MNSGKLPKIFLIRNTESESPLTMLAPTVESTATRRSKGARNIRRIAIDYEFYSDTGEAMVQLAFCRLMYNKLCD